MGEADAIRYIENESKKFKLQLSEEAINALLEKTGISYDKDYDTDFLFSSLVLLSLYSKDKKITKEDVSLAIKKRPTFSIWGFFDAVDSKNYCLAKDMINRAKRFYNNDIEAATMLLSLSRWRYKLLFIIKKMQANKVPNNEIIEFCSNFYKLEKADHGHVKGKQAYSENLIRRFCISYGANLSIADMYSLKELLDINLCLHDCWKIFRKNSRNEFDFIFQNFLMTACNMLDKSLLKEIRSNEQIE
jgi:DNA polymerase III delta subunit